MVAAQHHGITIRIRREGIPGDEGTVGKFAQNGKVGWKYSCRDPAVLIRPARGPADLRCDQDRFAQPNLQSLQIYPFHLGMVEQPGGARHTVNVKDGPGGSDSGIGVRFAQERLKAVEIDSRRISEHQRLTRFVARFARAAGEDFFQALLPFPGPLRIGLEPQGGAQEVRISYAPGRFGVGGTGQDPKHRRFFRFQPCCSS